MSETNKANHTEKMKGKNLNKKYTNKKISQEFFFYWNIY